MLPLAFKNNKSISVELSRGKYFIAILVSFVCVYTRSLGQTYVVGRILAPITFIPGVMPANTYVTWQIGYCRCTGYLGDGVGSVPDHCKYGNTVSHMNFFVSHIKLFIL